MNGSTARTRRSRTNGSGRRAELLALAARLFAERGYVSTTVRDIADAAGILSGSLYHHFDSKESMADEILRGFLDDLFGTYAEIMDSGLGPRRTLEAVVRASFRSIHDHPAEVAIYQNEAKHLTQLERFAYIDERNVEFRDLWRTILGDGVRDGVFRADLDIELVYRFIRDTVWVAVRWYNPEGTLSADDVAQQYLGILLDGIATRRRRATKTGDTHG
ncbi:TetR/AcrR family transcriptional regulator [Saccharomonospora iraqiensis]|uniref:TetR/AcrR family transcriptional regulator n=1 Tax=Saccharomonospora iraqiensis TaxID=52698 RepID=UPI00022DF0B3|nr:TetR/AcrR family transcriptional regulator [Saccharomonospora iraqiensis]